MTSYYCQEAPIIMRNPHHNGIMWTCMVKLNFARFKLVYIIYIIGLKIGTELGCMICMRNQIKGVLLTKSHPHEVIFLFLTLILIKLHQDLGPQKLPHLFVVSSLDGSTDTLHHSMGIPDLSA